MSYDSIKLPNDLSPKSNKILVFDCLLLFGDELGNFYDQKMRKILGDNWLPLLAQQRNDYNLTLNDPDFVIKEPLRSDSPLRAVLPKSTSFYKNLDILRKIRNFVAHNKTEGGYEQTREILGLLLAVSLDIELTHCTNEYAKAIKRVEELKKGNIFKEDLEPANRVKDFEDKFAEIEELLFEEKEKSANVARQLEEARSVVVIKEMEFEALFESEQAKTASVQKIEKELEISRREVEELRIQLEINAQRTEDLKKSEINLRNLVASLAAPTVDKEEIEANQVNKKADKLKSTQEVGSVWNRPKGNRKIVLSVSSRNLVDSKNGKVLANTELAQTKKLAEQWLTIRPEGGRVFIDSDGNATTLIDDRLIYLGNVTGLFN